MSIKGQLIVGVTAIAILSLACSAATYFVVAHTLFHGVAAPPAGPFSGGVRFRLQPAAFAASPAWLVDAVMLLLVFTPFLFLGLFAYLFARRFSRGISQPIRALVQAVQKIQAHDLDFEIDDHGGHEIGVLLRAFEEMRLDLREALVRQWSLEDERRDMLAAISHDLRTPATIIHGHAELLLETPELSQSARRSAEAIERNSKRVVRLLEDFRRVMDVESPHFELSPVDVDLAAFMDEKLAEYEAMASAAELHLECCVEGGQAAAAPVALDVDRLSQVMDNLMANAVRHTPRGGRITWSVRIREHDLTVRVQDSGSGFPGPEIDKVFRRFFQGPAAQGAAEGHAGLGLFIVKELVERQGGRVAAENSADGHGAAVTFELPLAVAKPALGQSGDDRPQDPFARRDQG